MSTILWRYEIMGKSINTLNFHNTLNTGNSLILTSGWIPGAAGLAGGNVFVVKETGPKRYIVTDGAVTGEVYLVETSDIKEGEAYLQIADTDEFVRQIYENVLATSKNNIFSWSLTADDTADLVLPSSTFPAQATVKTATINAAGPDKLVEQADKTIDFDYADFKEEAEDTSGE